MKKLKNTKIKILVGGKTRAESSKICLNYLKKINPRNVFIHDAARPNFSVNLILKLLKGLKNNDGIVPVIDVVDTVKLKPKLVDIRGRKEALEVFTFENAADISV